MLRLPTALVFFYLSSSIMSTSCNTQDSVKPHPWPEGIRPPLAETKPHLRTVHGDSVNDPYYWMIDYFKKGPDSTKVLNYLKAENAYLDTMMAGLKPLREKLFSEIKGRIKEKDESVPFLFNGYYYYTRTEEGKQYYKYCRKKGNLNAPEEILLDVDQLAEGKAYFSVSGFAVSDDNRLLAFGTDEVSRRQYTIRIKDLQTGKMLPDAIPNTEADPVWAADNKTLFYTAKNPVTLLSEKIRRHTLGAPVSADLTVYEEKDKSNYINVKRSKNKQYVLINSAGTLSSETRYLPADQPNAPFKVFQPRMKDVLYDVIALDDRFLILTNQNALNFRLMECGTANTSADNWKELIPHRSDVLLEQVEEFLDFLVFSERKNGLVNLRVKNRKDGSEHAIAFEEPAYMAWISENPEYKSTNLRYEYNSMVTPASVYDYNLNSRSKKLMKQQEIVGGYDATKYKSERIYVTARDGVKIPVSIVYKKGFEQNGRSPLLLYGYGSYGSSLDATFSIGRLSLLNRGFAFAMAHIRGGQELGRQWYEDGKMMKKKNTFNDFIDVAGYLVKEKYTDSSHLYAQGGSAGGLLMGAVLNMAPGLFNGVIAQVPFVDVVNTMLDESIPLTTNEFDEWGNPVNKEAYDYMKSYSPYENVQAREYPNILVTTGLHDSQVQYFEPAKWVARLRATKTDKNLLLLHTNMDFGHGGASGRFDYIKDIALNYAFLLGLEGITN